jgi:hypothetical protein
VLEAVFVLLESPSPSRRIFIDSHSLPPLWFVVSVLHMVFQTRILPGVGWIGSPSPGLASFWDLLWRFGLAANNRVLLIPLPKQSMLSQLVVALSSFGSHRP